MVYCVMNPPNYHTESCQTIWGHHWKNNIHNCQSSSSPISHILAICSHIEEASVAAGRSLSSKHYFSWQDTSGILSYLQVIHKNTKNPFHAIKDAGDPVAGLHIHWTWLLKFIVSIFEMKNYCLWDVWFQKKRNNQLTCKCETQLRITEGVSAGLLSPYLPSCVHTVWN